MERLEFGRKAGDGGSGEKHEGYKPSAKPTKAQAQNDYKSSGYNKLQNEPPYPLQSDDADFIEDESDIPF